MYGSHMAVGNPSMPLCVVIMIY